ncbi:aspartyl-phosphate phosphatase Spo0E family protein [Neobacillus notoginsengisoli]|uniref:Aspartyl-phosphate phosphatase Spo0E family protein n=1 Tax=Neobacillus notoginsengisoli TaxID=1578198 RepID=A0A417Z0C7_9BACI|nr:aspartyl-phosphate phosphatase Spo0E family protein [Neobacillus notoginsengisoli]
MLIEPDELISKIEYLRNELINTGLQKGLTSTEAITISQELDQYIVECQRCFPEVRHCVNTL